MRDDNDGIASQDERCQDLVAPCGSSEQMRDETGATPLNVPPSDPAALPPHLQVRTFWSLLEAKRFRSKVIAQVTPRVTLRSFGKKSQVAYRADSVAPLKHYRDRSRYSVQEEHFIVRQYMMWEPLSALAERLDRKVSAVESRLVNRGFRVLCRIPAYGVGQLGAKAGDICRELDDGTLSDETAQTLIQIGVVRDLTPEQSEIMEFGCGIALRAFSRDDKRRLMSFALDYNELDTAYKLASDLSRPGPAYILALQMHDPFRALLALKEMRSTHPLLRAATTATANFIRYEVTTTLPDFLRNWFNHANFGRGTYEASCWDPRPTGRAIIERLSLVLRESAYSWPPDLLTIVRIIKDGPYTPEELRRSQNHLAAWLSADLMRVAVAREEYDSEQVRKMAMKLAVLNALDGGYVPNLPRLFADLATVLTYDADLADTVRNNMSGTGPYFVELDPDAQVDAE
jgi:hypothetical protein